MSEFDEFLAEMQLEDDCLGLVFLSLVAGFFHMMYSAAVGGLPLETIAMLCAGYVWLLAGAGQYRVVVGSERVRVEER